MNSRPHHGDASQAGTGQESQRVPLRKRWPGPNLSFAREVVGRCHDLIVPGNRWWPAIGMVNTAPHPERWSTLGIGGLA